MKFLNISGAFSLCFLLFLSILNANSATLYADKTLANNCTSENYSIQDRDCRGSDGNAFKSIQESLDALNVGDTIMIRGGTYREGHIDIDYKKSGTSWQAGQHNTLMSYPGEWAILDGENGGGDGGTNGLKVGDGNSGTGCVLGHSTYPSAGQAHMKYWKFERLEIINGASADGQWAAGFWGTAGPFIFSHCNIHDNLADVMNNNPAGIKGHVWQDTVVEYCNFKNNGSPTTHHNSAQLMIYSDYRPNDIARLGFTDVGHHTMRNTIRYNLFEGGTVAIKYKQDQFFTGRDTNQGQPNNDNKSYGDNIHHNIILNSSAMAIDARQDFIQIHNNIIDSCYSGIAIGEDDTRSIYNAVVYNNTIINPTDHGISRVHTWWPDYVTPTQTTTYSGHDYNNILDQVRDGWNWSDIGVVIHGTFNGLVPDYSGYRSDRNLFHNPKKDFRDPDGTFLTYIGTSDNRLTESNFESRYPGTDLFHSESDGLYKGTNGAQRYKTLSTFTVDSGLTIANAGLTHHPYLTNTALPSYIGAANPNRDSGTSWSPETQDGDDSGWIDYVLSLSSRLSSANPPVPPASTIPSSPDDFMPDS